MNRWAERKINGRYNVAMGVNYHGIITIVVINIQCNAFWDPVLST